MIGYVTLGTNDLGRASAFYDALFAPIKARQIPINDRIVGWSVAKGSPMFAVAVPFDGKPASAGNGTMVAVNVGSRALVEQMHALGLELGAKDEGPPGPRGAGNFFGGYLRDLEGNKLTLFCLEG